MSDYAKGYSQALDDVVRGAHASAFRREHGLQLVKVGDPTPTTSENIVASAKSDSSVLRVGRLTDADLAEMIGAMTEARDHIRSCHGTDERPGSDSADIVDRLNAILARVA